MITLDKVEDKFPHKLSAKVNEIIDILKSPIEIKPSETGEGRVERTNAKTVLMVPSAGQTLVFDVCEDGVPVQYRIPATPA